MHIYSTYRPQNQPLPHGNLSETASYTFSAKEKDSETSLSYFGARYYTSDLSIWLSVDPMSAKYPSLSPYIYCANNPIKLVDPNGNFPIIPFLIKAGINAMADCLMQAAMNYYSNPQTAGDLRASFLNINGWITLKSGAEGAIPWKIPGGKAGRAAVTAAGDVLAYFCASPKQYTTKQALEDFTVGFIGELAGGGLNDLIAKYGAPAVAKGLCRIPGFSVNKIRGLTGYNLVSDYAQNLTKRLKGSTCKEAKGDGFIINYQDFRIMNSGGERAEPYFRISNKKGNIDINGRYSSDRGKTHCSFDDDPTEKIIEIIKTNKNL